MSGRLTLWGSEQMLRTFFIRDVEAPESFYMALIKDVAPTQFVSGSELDEPIGGGYQRVEIPNDSGYWFNDAQPQVVSTNQEITFTTATEDWGRLRYWALCDSPDGGNVYFVGQIDDVFEIFTDDTAIIAEGDLTVTYAMGAFTAEES